MSRRLLWLGIAMSAMLACGDLFGPPLRTAVLNIIPVFGPYAAFQSEADRLRVRIFLDSAGVFPPTPNIDDTLDVDAGTREASGDFVVPVVQSPQRVLVMLDAFKSATGEVVFSGQDTLEVEQQTGDQPPAEIEIPVIWVGKQAGRIEIAPSDTAVASGATFTYRATVFDTAGNVDPELPARFKLANPGDAVVLTVDSVTGVASAATGIDSVVSVIAFTLDTIPVEDTARVAVGQIPAAVVVSPGFLNVAIGGSAAVTSTVFDAQGNVLPIGVTWTSGTPSVATVDDNGGVTGLAEGTAIIVGSILNFSDSLLVTVPPSGNVVVTVFADGRAFRVPVYGDTLEVGDTVVVDVMADMQITPDELLGSYNATLTWDQSVLGYVDIQTVDFAAPTVNETNVGSGELRFSSADASGVSGQVVVARVRFEALAEGTATPTILISEMSAAVTFTDLLSRVTVTNGYVKVVP